MPLPDYVLNGQDVSQKPQKGGLPDYVLNQPDIADTSHPLTTTGYKNTLEKAPEGNRFLNRIGDSAMEAEKKFKEINASGDSWPSRQLQKGREVSKFGWKSALGTIGEAAKPATDYLKQDVPSSVFNPLSVAGKVVKPYAQLASDADKKLEEVGGETYRTTKAGLGLVLDTVGVKAGVENLAKGAGVSLADDVSKLKNKAGTVKDIVTKNSVEKVKDAMHNSASKYFNKALGIANKPVIKKTVEGIEKANVRHADAAEGLIKRGFDYKKSDNLIGDTMAANEKQLEEVFKGYDDIQRQAGANGAVFDAKQVVAEVLDPIIANKKGNLMSGSNAHDVAQAFKDEWLTAGANGDGIMTLSEAQSLLQKMNEHYGKVKLTDSNADIIMKLAASSKKQMSTTIDKFVPPKGAEESWSGLRKQYGASVDMQEQLAKQQLKAMQQTDKTLADKFSAIEISGLAWAMSVNPQMILPTAAHSFWRRLKMWQKTPEYNLKKGFEEVEKFNKIADRVAERTRPMSMEELTRGRRDPKTLPKTSWELSKESGQMQQKEGMMPDDKIMDGDGFAVWNGKQEHTVQQPTSRTAVKDDSFTMKDSVNFDEADVIERNGKKLIWNNIVKRYVPLADDIKINEKAGVVRNINMKHKYAKGDPIIDIEGKGGSIPDETSMLEGSYSDKSKGKKKGFGEPLPESNLQLEPDGYQPQTSEFDNTPKVIRRPKGAGTYPNKNMGVAPDVEVVKGVKNKKTGRIDPTPNGEGGIKKMVEVENELHKKGKGGEKGILDLTETQKEQAFNELTDKALKSYKEAGVSDEAAQKTWNRLLSDMVKGNNKSLSQLLHKGNKTSRKIFEDITGLKFGKDINQKTIGSADGSFISLHFKKGKKENP